MKPFLQIILKRAAIHLMLLCVLSGCQPSTLPLYDYINWVENLDNGLRQTKEMGALVFNVQYKPAPYILAKEAKSISALSNLEAQKKDLDNMHYFNLSYQLKNSQQNVVKYNLNGNADYQERIYYLSYYLKKDIHLIDGQDTLDCELFHFVRNYGLKPQAEFVLGFPQTQNGGDKQLVIDEKVFNTGKLTFRIAAEDLKDMPTLITHKS